MALPRLDLPDHADGRQAARAALPG
jgi:hypothetical protein